MNLDWLNAAIAAAGLIGGGVTGLVTAVWRIANIDRDIRKDITQDFAEAVQEGNRKLENAVHAFDETLRALRQKINDVELEAHKHFVAKNDFDDFRKEYREDMRDLKTSLNGLRNKL